jgi:hypothetical protein
MNGNWMGAIVLSRGSSSPGDSIRGVQFSTNSVLSSGAYSDIQLFNTGATGLLGNQFVLSGAPSKYLVEVQNPSVQMDWGRNFFREDGTAQPWATAITNDTWSIPNNRYGVAGGYQANAGGLSSVALGYQPAATGQGSLVTGNNGGDGGKRMFAYGGATFSHGGGHQMGWNIMSASSTSTTPVRLTTDRNSAGAANAFNLLFDNQTITLKNCVAIAQARGAANRAVWDLPDILLKRDTGAASVAIMTGTGVLVSGTQTITASTSGFSALGLSVTADATNGGLNVTGTGLAATNTDWSMTCESREID